MTKPPYRSNPFRTNRYQRRMIAIPFVSILFLNGLATFLILFFHPHLIQTFFLSPQSIDYINQFTLLALFMIWIFFLLVAIWTYIVSSSLVGAFDRLTRELDDILITGKKRFLHVRRDDHPANEVVNRINKLINKLHP